MVIEFIYKYNVTINEFILPNYKQSESTLTVALVVSTIVCGGKIILFDWLYYDSHDKVMIMTFIDIAIGTGGGVWSQVASGAGTG